MSHNRNPFYTGGSASGDKWGPYDIPFGFSDVPNNPYTSYGSSSKSSLLLDDQLEELEQNHGSRKDNDNGTQEQEAASLHKVIVGVDFGTTYTGVSYVHTSGSHLKSLEDVHCIKSWPGPGREGDAAWKTPSRIAYASDNGINKNAWGYSVTPKMRGYTWMKLRLDPVQASKFDDPSLKLSEGEGVMSLPLGKSAVDVCADFLREVAIFAYDQLQQRVSPEILSISPLEFWFTVPAVWSDKAKNDTLRAAEKAAKAARLSSNAGSATFLIAEPEAAAVAAISSVTEGGSRQQIKPGDNILVCDCGGGTVDITTYAITDLEPSLEFREYLVGIGGKCGSTYIDRAFLRWMENTFGQAFTNLPWEKKGPASRFMKDFEGHKKDFGTSIGDSSKECELTLPMKGVPDSSNYDTDEGVVKLLESDLKSLFDPVVDKIEALIESQLVEDVKASGRITIKTVILVGGFGDSQYLNKRLRSYCERKGGIRLICPENPQAAIVRGAALSGLHNIRPSSRRARRHYGVAMSEHFDRRRHKMEHLFISEWDGIEYAGGNMDWHLQKGEFITEKTEMSHNYVQVLYGENVSKLKYDTQVYFSDLDEAPTHVSERGVQKLVTIGVDLSGLDLSHCRTKAGKKKKMTELHHTIEVQFGSKRGVLCFRYLIDGKEAGSASVNFDGDEHARQDMDMLNTEAMKGQSCSVM